MVMIVLKRADVLSPLVSRLNLRLFVFFGMRCREGMTAD